MWCYLSFFWTLPACLCPVVFWRQLLLKASHANQSWQVVFLVPGVDNRYLLWSRIPYITKGDGEFNIRWQEDDRWHLLAQCSSWYHPQWLFFQFMCHLVRSKCRFRAWKFTVLCIVLSLPVCLLQRNTVLPVLLYFVVRELFHSGFFNLPLSFNELNSILFLVIFIGNWWWIINRCIPCRHFLKTTRWLERICLLVSRTGPLGISIYLCAFIKLII